MSEKFSSTTFEKKWGEKALGMGWTAIPSSLFFLQGNLAITPIAFNILLNLLAHWWQPGEWPHPSQESLSKRMSVSTRTIQRGLTELESKGLITRIRTSRDDPKYKGRNRYDLTNLVDALNSLTPYIKQKLNE